MYRVPLAIMPKIHMFRYWIKLLKADNNSVIKHIYIYIMLRNDADNNISYKKHNWAYQIKSMLQSLGLEYLGQISNSAIFFTRNKAKNLGPILPKLVQRNKQFSKISII